MIGSSQLELNSVLVRRWQIKETTSSLFHNPSSHRFKFENKITGQKKTFRSALYDDYYALSLISMFYRTIGVNLTQETFETVQSACFFPKLSIPVEGESDIQVALFGYENDVGELKGLHWGVYHDAKREEQTFEVGEDERVARAFIRYAPTTNYSDLQPKSDENEQVILKPGRNHYLMNTYTQHFRVSLIRDVDQRIQRIVLRYVSLLDPTVSLDENRWAVTLVSAMQSTDSSTWFGRNVGHAMLACEGIEEEQPFLKYIHFTQQPRVKHPNLKKEGEGQIECFERSVPLETRNGPTWIRPKDLVQQMLNYVHQEENKPRKFSLYHISFSLSVIWAVCKTDFLEIQTSDELHSEIIKYCASNLRTTSQTCLSCAYEIAVKCGIIFQPEASLRKPLEKIAMLKTAPTFLIPKGFDHSRLGEAIIIRNKQLSDKILSACVVLTPEDCHPEDCVKWFVQTMIEDTAATNIEIERINAMTSLVELMTDFQYKSKRW